jgi:hypothetical protein
MEVGKCFSSTRSSRAASSVDLKFSLSFRDNLLWRHLQKIATARRARAMPPPTPTPTMAPVDKGPSSLDPNVGSLGDVSTGNPGELVVGPEGTGRAEVAWMLLAVTDGVGRAVTMVVRRVTVITSLLAMVWVVPESVTVVRISVTSVRVCESPVSVLFRSSPSSPSPSPISRGSGQLPKVQGSTVQQPLKLMTPHE